MSKIRGMACVAGITALFAVSAPARAADCWRADEAGAAQIREFQSMLMVETLRCRASGIDIETAYNAFVTAERPQFQSVNATLRGHFGSGETAETGYDHFTTLLANAYGAGAPEDSGCDAAAALANQAATADSADALGKLAAANVPPRDLPGGACPIAPAVGATLAAQEPVTLPPEVVAALETIAGFTNRQAAPSARLVRADAAPVRVASAAP